MTTPTETSSYLGKPLDGWRLKLFTIIFEADTRAGRLFDQCLIFAILLSVAVVAMGSVGAVADRVGIWFEVLEHAPLHSKHRALIEVLRAHGAHIACDDFGTQECNFQRVMALPYEIIKLDRSLLLQAARTPHAFKMLTGLVEYLQRLGMKVVCEGVETLQHIEIANRLGCDYQQGYAYAMPSPLSRWA